MASPRGFEPLLQDRKSCVLGLTRRWGRLYFQGQVDISSMVVKRCGSFLSCPEPYLPQILFLRQGRLLLRKEDQPMVFFRFQELFLAIVFSGREMPLSLAQGFSPCLRCHWRSVPHSSSGGHPPAQIKSLVSVAGVEPATNGLKGRCSTA